MIRRVGALAAALVVWIAPAPALAGGALAIRAPARVSGDGRTKVPIRIELAARGALRDVELSATAGSVGSAEPRERAAVVEYRPPRVADDMVVRLTATARAGKRRLRARAEIAVTPAPIPPGEVGGDGPLGLKGPERLLLGEGARATLSSSSSSGKPSWAATPGEIREAGRSGSGFSADYLPPDTRRPQVAVVAATARDGSTYDWRAISLYGIGWLDLHGEPAASVTVGVGENEFGPVRLDRRGRARLPIFAPPGVRAARTVAVDQAGNRSQGTIPLGSSRQPAVLATCPPPGDRLRVFAAAPDGSAASGIDLEATASRGDLGPAREVAPGVYEMPYHAVAGAESGDRVRFEARLGGSRIKSACTAVLRGQRPSGLRIALDRERYRAGSGRRLPVTIELRYAGKLPRIDDKVRVFSNLGAIVEVSRATDTSFRAIWILPEDLTGRSKATVRASLAGDPTKVASATLALGPGEPARLEARLTGAGGDRAIAVRLSDRFGNPVPGARLEASARGGTVGSFREIEPGRYRAGYEASSDRRTDEITLRELGSGITRTVAVGPERRAENLLGLYARIGYLDNFGKVAAPVLAGGVRWRPPVLQGRLAAALEVGLYSSRSRDPLGDGEEVVTEVTGAPLLARVAYLYPFGSAAVYGGVCAGAVLVDARVSAPRAGVVTAERVRAAAGLFAGGSLDVGRGRLLAELGYLRASLDEPEIAGNVAGLHAAIGYLFEL